MTKDQLIKELTKIKGNPQIAMSSDAEGNSFSTLSDISSDMFYDKINREVIDKQDAKEIEEFDLSAENFQECIVLWPD